jgi:non-specific protein-tyrosine kinase
MEIRTPSVDNLDEGLDVRQYLSVLTHWAWLIILSALLAGTVSLFVSLNMAPSYRSITTVLVNEAPATKNADYNSVLMSKQLTSTYAEMMANDLVLGQVAEQVRIANTPEEMRKWIRIEPVRDTQIIQVSVQTTDPAFSASIANAIVSTFSTQIQDIQTKRFSQSKLTLETQLAETDKQIADLVNQAELAVTQSEKDRLDAKVVEYRTIYSNLLTSYEQIRLSEAQSVSSVVQVVPAVPNTDPVEPNIWRNTILAALLGFLIAAVALIARESLDDTVKTPNEITRKFDLPILGVIYHHSSEGTSPITISEPRSPVAEAYRALRTNINYASVDRPLRTILITSAIPGDGKSTTIINLGVVLAQNGKRVIIADCDLRRPQIHTHFGLTNRQGMSTLFASSGDGLNSVRQSTPVDGLTVVTSGSLPPNPSELMGSQKLQTILNTMRNSADIILIDTPPTLTVTDASALAPSLDGILLVVRPGKTKVSALRQTIEQLRQVNARILGIVMNDVAVSGKPYSYHYNYYHNYSENKEYFDTREKKKKGK